MKAVIFIILNFSNSPETTFSNFHVFFITLAFEEGFRRIIKEAMEWELIFYSFHWNHLGRIIFYRQSTQCDPAYQEFKTYTEHK